LLNIKQTGKRYYRISWIIKVPVLEESI